LKATRDTAYQWRALRRSKRGRTEATKFLHAPDVGRARSDVTSTFPENHVYRVAKDA
jgi:hypothetical protein